MTVREKRDILLQLKDQYDWDNYDEIQKEQMKKCCDELIQDNYMYHRFRDVLSKITINRKTKDNIRIVEGLEVHCPETIETSLKIATDFDIKLFKELLNDLGYDLIKKEYK